MPTYDYVCDACGHKFELFQGITENPKKKCPECGKSKLRRLFGTGGAIVFKGSGFYKTDYRSESYKKQAASDSGSGAKSDGAKSDGAKGSEASKSSGKSSDSSKGKPKSD